MTGEAVFDSTFAAAAGVGRTTGLAISSKLEVSSASSSASSSLSWNFDAIAAQSEKIGNLTAEVDSLKMRVGGGGNQDQSERIRELELELEAARS